MSLLAFSFFVFDLQVSGQAVVVEPLNEHASIAQGSAAWLGLGGGLAAAERRDPSDPRLPALRRRLGDNRSIPPATANNAVATTSAAIGSAAPGSGFGGSVPRSDGSWGRLAPSDGSNNNNASGSGGGHDETSASNTRLFGGAARLTREISSSLIPAFSGKKPRSPEHSPLQRARSGASFVIPPLDIFS